MWNMHDSLYDTSSKVVYPFPVYSPPARVVGMWTDSAQQPAKNYRKELSSTRELSLSKSTSDTLLPYYYHQNHRIRYQSVATGVNGVARTGRAVERGGRHAISPQAIHPAAQSRMAQEQASGPQSDRRQVGHNWRPSIHSMSNISVHSNSNATLLRNSRIQPAHGPGAQASIELHTPTPPGSIWFQPQQSM